MKKIFPLIILFFLVALFESARAQEAIVVTEPPSSAGKSAKLKAVERQYFGCAKCDFLSKVAGTCPNDQIPLIRIGDYYCPALHGVTSENAGNCPEHNIPLSEMMLKYIKLNKPPSETPADKQIK